MYYGTGLISVICGTVAVVAFAMYTAVHSVAAFSHGRLGPSAFLSNVFQCGVFHYSLSVSHNNQDRRCSAVSFCAKIP